MDKVQAIGALTTFDIYKVLASQKLTDKQKAEFIKKNSAAIKNISTSEISKAEFQELMAHRPLIRFRPLKNSFTKQGDDIILAKALGIEKKNIKKYINSIIDNNFEIQNSVDQDKIEKIKAYVYRHGTKAQVIAFLDYELSDTKNTLEKLYKTLEQNSGGLCDYFSRPVHRMDNITLGKLYNTIDKNLKKSYAAGYINENKLNSTSQWALIKIYEIQNNSKLIKAYETYKSLI